MINQSPDPLTYVKQTTEYHPKKMFKLNLDTLFKNINKKSIYM